MSIVSDSSGMKSTRSHFSHPYNPREYIRYQLGIIDGEEGFDRFFKAMDGLLRLLPRIQIFVNRGLIFSKKGKEKALDPERIQKLKQIWYGPTWEIIIRDPNNIGHIIDRKIAYKQYALPHNVEAIKFPALKNLGPLDQIKSEKFLLRIREPVKISEALGGMEYKQVVLQGKWYHDFKFNRKPIFNSQSDIEQNTGITMSVGRRWFFSRINMLGQYAGEHVDNLYADIQELLDDDLKKGFESMKQEKVIKQFSDSWND